MKVENNEEVFDPHIEYFISRNKENVVSLLEGWDIFDDTVPSFGKSARFVGVPFPTNLSEIRKIRIPAEEKPWDAIINIGVQIWGVRDGKEQITGLLILSSHDTKGIEYYDTEWKISLFGVKGNEISEICSVEDKAFDSANIKRKFKEKFGTIVNANQKAGFVQQAIDQCEREIQKLNTIYIPAIEEAVEKEPSFGLSPRLDVCDLPAALFPVGSMVACVGNSVSAAPVLPKRITRGAIGNHFGSFCIISEMDIFGFKEAARSTLKPQITGIVEIFAEYTNNLTEAFRVISIRGNNPQEEPIRVLVKPDEQKEAIVNKLRDEFRKQPKP